MGDPSAVGFGLASASGAGTADFLAKTTTDRVGALTGLLYLEAFGAPLIVLLALWVDGFRAPPLGPILELATISTLSLAGLYFLYRAFERGRLSIVAPLSSGYPAMVVVLSVLVLGERLSPFSAAGIAVTLGGIALLATRGRSRTERSVPVYAGVGSALLAFLAFGGFYFGLKFVIGPVPAVTAAAVTRLVGLALVAPVALARGRARWPPRELRARAVGYPVFDTLSLVAFNVGVAVAGSLAVLTTVSGLYSAITLLWAVLILRDRPDRWQWLGCGLIFLGVTLLALT